MVEKIKTILFLMLMAAFAACSGLSGTAGSDAASAITATSAATEIAPDAGETELNDASGVGTVVYFPSKPKELSTMTFLLGAVEGDTFETEFAAESTLAVSEGGTAEDTTAEEESEEMEIDEVSAEYSNSCRKMPGFPYTQGCLATPEKYSFAVSGIYLVTCLDETGVAVLCSRTEQDVSARQALYEGDTVTLSVTEGGISFPSDFNEITSDMTVSGVQFLMSGFSQQFPSSNAEQAAKFASHLQGKSYSRCTTSGDDRSAAEMESYCGLPDAELGDILFDFDSDGAFGYLNPETLEPTSVFETATRPAFYDDGVLASFMENLVGMRSFFMDGSATHEGFFAPIFAPAATQAVMAGSAYDFKITFDLENTIGFIDGGGAMAEHGRRICVAGVVEECPYDDDEGSVGVYNPYYDALVLTRAPDVSLTVEENEGETIE